MEESKRPKNTLKWLPEEEQYIKYLRETKMVYSWKEISCALFQKFPNKIRTGTQCRDRYVNYLRFGSQSQRLKEWTKEEEYIISEQYLKYGPKWKIISKFLSNRSQNSTKNKFYSSIRKFIRKINQCIPKNVKDVTIEEIVNFLNCNKFTFNSTLNQLSFPIFKKNLVRLIFQIQVLDSCQPLVQVLRSYTKNIQFPQKIKTTKNIKASKGLKQEIDNYKFDFKQDDQQLQKKFHLNNNGFHLQKTSETISTEQLFQKEKIILERKLVGLFTPIFRRQYEELINFDINTINCSFPEPWIMCPQPYQFCKDFGQIKLEENNQEYKQLIKSQEENVINFPLIEK